MVQQGDRVSVGGVEAVVESSWGQGRHRAFKLSDGRVVLDLTDAEVVKAPPKAEEKPTRKWDWLPKDGHHDLEE
jgi:hypothetical protein